MSAFLVGKEHVDAMVRVGLEGPSGVAPYLKHGGGSPLRWYVSDPWDAAEAASDSEDYFARLNAIGRELRLETADATGAMLWTENLASIQARYPDTMASDTYPGPIGITAADVAAYTFPVRFPLPGGVVGGVGPSPTAVEGLKLLDCYTYQSCEHAGWRTSEAHSFCEALRSRLIGMLPGYSEANGWEWTVPAGVLS